MKKLLSVCLAGALLLGSAGAYQVPNAGGYRVELRYLEGGTINNNSETQADLLHALGLFQGTDNGYELDRTMRRDEAAAMLVRFLGVETEALAGTWEHPFTDVPQWADKYVGYLYENGLTKGVSATQFGAAEPVLPLQYAVFLSRALAGNDDYLKNSVLSDNEASNAPADTDCTRCMAVHLSVRALTLPHTVNGDTRTMAQVLLEKKVFTQQQFAETAWDVLPPAYATAANGDIVCTIAGIETARNTEKLLLDTQSAVRNDQGTLYAYGRDGDEVTYYAVAPRTLQTTALGTRTAAAGAFDGKQYVCTLDGTDYLLEQDRALLSCDGKTLIEVLSPAQLAADGFTASAQISVDIQTEVLTVTAPNGVYLLRKSNQTPTLLATNGAVELLMQNDYAGSPFAITGPVEGVAGEIQCFDLTTGDCVDSYPVAADAKWQTQWLYLYGPNGLYQVYGRSEWTDETYATYEINPRLKQWTELPVLEMETVREGAGQSAPYILTEQNGETLFVHLADGGTYQIIMQPAKLGILNPTLSGAEIYDGAPSIFGRNGKDAGVYGYLASNMDDYVSVAFFTPDEGSAAVDTEALCRAEQARLDALTAS